MKRKNENNSLEKFFNTPNEIITSEKALKDVIPVNWKEVLKDRKDNTNQILKLK